MLPRPAELRPASRHSFSSLLPFPRAAGAARNVHSAGTGPLTWTKPMTSERKQVKAGILSLALISSLAIAACGSISTNSTPTAPSPAAAPPPAPAPQPAPAPAPEPAPPPAPAPQPPSPPVPPGPTISNLTASFSGQKCTRQADHLTGSALVVQFDFTDPNGDVPGGQVMLNRTYNTGRSEWHASAVAGDAMLTGSGSAGHIEVDNECPLYDNNQSSVESITLIDATGLTSNRLSATMQRPPGAP